MRYYLKKTIAIYKQDNKICLGRVDSENDYLEINYNEEHVAKINNVIKFGIKKKEDTFFFNLLMSKDFLENFYNETNKRNDLFVSYITKNKINKNLLSKKILIFGAGGGGGTLTYMLAQFGFNNITVIDFDKVDFSDIEKTMVFDKSMNGVSKVEALKQKIKINFSLNISTFDEKLIEFDDLDNFISNIKPDFIIKAADPKGIFVKNLNNICFSREIPYIQMAYSYEHIKIGPILVPKITSCNEFISQENTKFYGSHYEIDKFERMFENYFIHPSVSFNINILASIILKEVVFFLLEEFEYCETIGRMIILNTLNFDKKTYLFNCNQECDVCK